MSLTNPNKPVTEARLQEFYHRIKSYLGFTEMPSEDMEEVISPLPSVQPRYHKYSTEEHIVGEWIDGSTLYEKTVYTASLNASGTDTTISHGISNLDHVINAFGYTYGGTGTARRSMLSPYYNNGNWQCSFYVNDVNVVIQVGTSFYNAHKDHGAYVTLQYTKSE